MGTLEQLEKGAAKLGIILSETQRELFRSYSQEILLWNLRANLISKRDEQRIATRHFLDSLTSLPHLPQEKGIKIADVGAGAGFPGLPLRIVRDDLHLTLVESKRKKVLFLRHVVKRLGLDGVEVILGRAEELTSYQNYYEIVLSRGVGKLTRLLRVCFPLLKKGGTLIAYKGGGIEEEVAEAVAVLSDIGGEFLEVKRVPLPTAGAERNLILVRKGA